MSGFASLFKAALLLLAVLAAMDRDGGLAAAAAGNTTAAPSVTTTTAPLPSGGSEQGSSSGGGSDNFVETTRSPPTIAPVPTDAPTNATTPSPPLPEALAPEAILGMQSTAALISLAAAVFTPCLCPQGTRTSLIISQSQCQYNIALQSMDPSSYPLQVGFADDRTGVYFAASVLLGPFVAVFFALHYAVVIITGGSADAPDQTLVRRELAEQRHQFPSLSLAALCLFFWQPLVSSGVTVVVHGESAWPKVIALVVVVASIAVGAFAVRWYSLRIRLLELVPCDEEYRRRHVFYAAARKGAADVAPFIPHVNFAALAPATAAGTAAATDTTSVEVETPAKRTKRKVKSRQAPGGGKDGARASREDGDEMQPRSSSAAAGGSAAGGTKTLDRLLLADWFHVAAPPTAPGPPATAAAVAANRAGQSNRPAAVGRAAWSASVHPVILKIFDSELRWADRGGRYGFCNRHCHIFRQYAAGREWFMVAEIVFCTAFGVIDGFKPLTVAGCWMMGTCTFAFFSLYTLLLVALRPYLTHWNNISFILLAMQQAVSSGLLLGAGSNFVASLQLTAQTYAFSCLSVVTAKGLVDVGVKLYLAHVKRSAWKKIHGGAARESDSDEDSSSDEDDAKRRPKKPQKKGRAAAESSDSSDSEEDGGKRRAKGGGAKAAAEEPLLRVPNKKRGSDTRAAADDTPRRNENPLLAKEGPNNSSGNKKRSSRGRSVRDRDDDDDL